MHQLIHQFERHCLLDLLHRYHPEKLGHGFGFHYG
jgi:hypothetical protein